MRIAILGGGFTGLSAAYRLLKKGHDVTIFEKENALGGLAIGFKKPGWQWSLEKAYHHWFTSDDSVLNLAKEINHPVIIKRPSTDIFIQGKRLPFDSLTSVLRFPYLSFVDKLRLGFSIIYLKLTDNYRLFEGRKALPWIKKFMGEKATNLIWNPLFTAKFGKYKDSISLTWFWARIKKRTPSLAYPQGGFEAFTYSLAQKIENLGGNINLNNSVTSIKSEKNKCHLLVNGESLTFDKTIVTLPSPIFVKLCSELPKLYVKKLSSILHLHALVLILTFKKSFMNSTYWLNITDKKFPFLVLAEHTNFMDQKHYGNEHILYIGNYLPFNHPYLKMSKEQLLKMFVPYLKKINPTSHFSILTSHLFVGPFAQPIVTTNYPKLIPQFKTPIKNIYLANLDMVYPWDRGTNYAVELGEKVAEIILKDEN